MSSHLVTIPNTGVLRITVQTYPRSKSNLWRMADISSVKINKFSKELKITAVESGEQGKGVGVSISIPLSTISDAIAEYFSTKKN